MNRRVTNLIRQFKEQFRDGAAQEVPASLRQESSNIVFISLLEEDEPPMTPASALQPEFGLAEVPSALPGEMGGMSLDSLLAPPMEPGVDMNPDMNASVTTEPQTPSGGALSLEDMLI